MRPRLPLLVLVLSLSQLQPQLQHLVATLLRFLQQVRAFAPGNGELRLELTGGAHGIFLLHGISLGSETGCGLNKRREG